MNRSAARSLLLFRLDRKSQVSWLHPVSPFLPLPLPDFKETLVSRKRGEKSLLNLVDAMLPALTKGARGHDVKAAERSGSDFFLPEMSPLPNLSLFLFGASFLWKMRGRGGGAKRGEKPDRPSSAAVGGKIGGRDGGEDEWRGVMQSVHFLIWGGKRMEEEEEATPTTAQSRR